MKILAIHNFHRKGSASGDDQVFNKETVLLESHQNSVVKYTTSNDEFDNSSIIKKFFYTFGMVWSFKHYYSVDKLIKKNRPDIVHIHTFFPLLSPSILYAAKRNNIPVVATLHDTRFVCPCATSLRGAKLCNKCGDGHYFRMCKYGCFKGSYLQSFLVACVFKYHRIRKSFYKQIDKYICLNENQIQLLIDTGFDRNKIIKKYNFVSDTEQIDKRIFKYNGLPKRYSVFYGRIGEEKGVKILMKIWDDSRMNQIPLVVMGSGPLEKEFQAWSEKHKNVLFLGYTQHEKCLNIVRNCEFVIFPSIWYEGCSMVEIESQSLGKGIIATDLGFSSEAIQDGYNGYKIGLGDINGFVEKILYLWNNKKMCNQFGKNARKDYEDKYREEDNYLQLMNIYNEVIKNYSSNI